MTLKLEQWLALIFFGLIILFTSIVSLSFYAQLQEATLERVQNQLLSINILKKRLVEQYLDASVLMAPDSAGTPMLTPALVADLEDIVTERTGMGTTGESYLVDEQGVMITASRFFPDTISGGIAVATEGFRKAQAGRQGVSTYDDYRGVPIVGAYRRITLPQQSWVILTEIDVTEAMQSVRDFRNQFLGLSLLLLLVSGVASVVLARRLTRPIRVLQHDVTVLARGEFPSALPQASRVTEIRRVTQSIRELIQRLGQTARFAEHIGNSKFDAVYIPLSPKDVLGNALLTMRDQLVQLNKQQERLERETKQQLISTQENERERIARDIHDGIGPLLTTAKLKLTSLPDSAAQKEVRQLIDEVINELRRISRNLMPAVLRDFGPGEALNQLVEQTRQSTDLELHYANDLSRESSLPKEVSITLYRIAQEAINNTIKHAAATQIVMSLTEFDDQVVFYYKDNGRGLPTQTDKTNDGSGLKNIQERIRILEGTVRIYSDQETVRRTASVLGTIIEAEIPLI